MTTPKIFGREPAFIAGLLEALLALLISFDALGFIGINGAEGQAVIGALIAAIIGFYVAYVTKDTLLGVGLALLKAGIALMAYYKYELSQEQVATVIALASILLGSFQRTQTGPAVEPSFDLKQHSTPIPPTGEQTETVAAVSTTTGAIVEKAAPDAD